MASAIATQKYALLVGIDLYDEVDPDCNLSGCVRDVTMVYDLLQSTMNIPKGQITVLKGPISPGAKMDYNAPDAPTGRNVLKELSKLEKTPAGSFIFFYYAGHGDRAATIHPSRKVDNEGKQAKDELVCTWEKNLTDVTLGKALDKLAMRHTVCAVLDCCHSGGADRQSVGTGKDEMIRCLSLYAKEVTHGEIDSLNADEDEKLEPELEPKKKSGSMRNGVLEQSYLYRHREYNLFVACQPRETAKEKVFRDLNGQKVWHGMLTYYFVKAIKQLQQSPHPVTYGQLQSVLTAQIAASEPLIPTERQQPMHLGDEDRHVFAASRDATQPFYLLANVTGLSKGKITINRGWASNVAENDELTFYAPTDIVFGIQRGAALNSVHGKVSHVQDLDSEVICSGKDAARVQIGYYAVFTRRTKPVVIDIQLPVHISAANIQRVQDECLASIQSSMPLDLNFGNFRSTADYVVTINQDLQLRNPTSNPQSPSSTTSTPATTLWDSNELQQLIRSLGFYHLATIPSFQHKGTWAHKYEYSFTPQALNPKDPKAAIAAYRFSFKNKQKQALYIVLLNLTADYGVESLLPGRQQPWHEVDGGKPISFTVYIVVPTSLKQVAKSKPGFVLRDVFKLFVTSQGSDFRHYLLPGLEVDPAKVEIRPKAANSRILNSPRCIVEEKEILTTVP